MRDTIYMAREAGFKVGPSRDGPDEVRGAGLNLRWFEALVRADEREACAKVVEAAKADEEDWDSNDWNQAVEFCASRIRARGNT
jgi:hypothetical protein